MNVALLFLKYYISQVSRHLFWVLRLSQSKFGKNVRLSFPIIREGKGSFHFNDDGVIQKHSEIGLAKGSTLKIGKNSLLENKSTILLGQNCHVEIGSHFKLGNNARLYVKRDWTFGDHVKIETNCSIFAREQEKSGKLNIGNGSHIGDFTIIDLVDDVFIGNEVAIGPNCTLYTHDHVYKDNSLPAWKGGIISKSIIIEDGAWIGSGVTILPGVTIGMRSVIAAGSVVTKNVEANVVYGGIPAKLIRVIE